MQPEPDIAGGGKISDHHLTLSYSLRCSPRSNLHPSSVSLHIFSFLKKTPEQTMAMEGILPAAAAVPVTAVPSVRSSFR